MDTKRFLILGICAEPARKGIMQTLDIDPFGLDMLPEGDMNEAADEDDESPLASELLDTAKCRPHRGSSIKHGVYL